LAALLDTLKVDGNSEIQSLSSAEIEPVFATWRVTTADTFLGMIYRISCDSRALWLPSKWMILRDEVEYRVVDTRVY